MPIFYDKTSILDHLQNLGPKTVPQLFKILGSMPVKFTQFDSSSFVILRNFKIKLFYMVLLKSEVLELQINDQILRKKSQN